MNTTIPFGLFVGLVAATSAAAAGLSTVHSVAAETKLKGDVMSMVGNRLYFATELGGANFLGGTVSFDLLVMGAYGHSAIQEFIFGSRTTRMVRNCAVPMLMSR